jgi:serine/threonine protein kinase
VAECRFAVRTKIGPYELLEFLGRGAFGEVWLAERDSAVTKSRLAVKLPLNTLVDLNAIRKEAEVWVRAGNHPNVLPMFEANIYDGQVVIVSEYAADGSLKQWLEKHGGKAPSIEQAVEMGTAILAGLEHLHSRGIVHRDLKPANILMQGECPRIADFGLARVLDPGATVTLAAGTPAYMAPEAFDGQRSVQTDLWSAGVILYQMLSGTLPFPSGDLMRFRKAIETEAPDPLPVSVPSALRQTVLSALDKDPSARFRSAADMRAALRHTLHQPENAERADQQCSSTHLKYYVYVSRTKVEMLYGQIPSVQRNNIAHRLNVDLSRLAGQVLLEGSIDDALLAKTNLVVGFLEEQGLVGTINQPRPFFKGQLALRWGPYVIPSGANAGGSTGLVYFGGETESTIIGLGGSLHHVIGRVGGAASHSHSATPVLVNVLSRELGISAGEMPEPPPPESLGPVDRNWRALKAVELASTQMEGPVENIEFVARLLLSGTEIQGYHRSARPPRQVLLGSPIYAALADG